MKSTRRSILKLMALGAVLPKAAWGLVRPERVLAFSKSQVFHAPFLNFFIKPVTDPTLSYTWYEDGWEETQ